MRTRPITPLTDLEQERGPSTSSAIRNTFGRFLRTGQREPSSTLPTSHVRTQVTRASEEKEYQDLPSFTPWYDSDKNGEEAQEFRQTMRRRRIRVLLGSFVVILLLIVAIILLVRLIRPRIRQAVDDISQSDTLNQSQLSCLQKFLDEAPANPVAYPCTSCLPTLQAVAPEFFTRATNVDQADGVIAAKQFCAMEAIFDSANEVGQASLAGAGWMQDVRTCAWVGATCDGTGQISVL